MILFTRCAQIFFIATILYLVPLQVSGQFLQESQSEEQIKKFAKYLYNLGLYDLAAEEYERLVYINEADPEHLRYLIKSYRGANKISQLNYRLDKIDLNNPDIINEYIYALMVESLNEEVSLLYQKHENVFSSKEKNRLLFDMSLSKKDWGKSKELFSSLDTDAKMKYESLISEIARAKYKSPTTAAILSGILPGSGRVYANDTIDGIISFLFVASTAYQSYRRFDQKGSKNVAAWIYGGVSLGFYISNIYGSHQSAKLYNNNIDRELHAKSLDFINRD